ncbi:hypothetical protein PTKIN_Ptkin13bG0249900 [Pterospermum kingtungense]
MDQHQQQQQPQPNNASSSTTSTSTATATTSTSDPPQQLQPPPSQPQPAQPQQPLPQTQTQTQTRAQSQTPQSQQQTTLPSPSTTSSTSSAINPNSNPNPNPNSIPTPLPSTPPASQQPPQPKPTVPTPHPRPTSATIAASSRPWQQHSSQFAQFSSSSHSVSSSPSPTLLSQPRGNIAVGVPSSHSSPSPPSPSPSQSTPYSGSFRHSFSGASSSSVSQARPMMQGIGMGSSIGSSSQMRPGGISSQHQQRPMQSSLRPPSSPTSQSPSTQNFQGHGLMRGSAIGSSASSTPSTPQTSQSPNQPWLSSGVQGKPPLPPPSYRPQVNSPSLQQRAHIPQPHHSFPTVSQQQTVSSPQVPQTISSYQQQEHFGQQFSQPRAPQSLPHQQQVSRAQGSANQKPSSLAMVQPSRGQLVNQNKAAIIENDESGGRILSKRSIHDLISQIDPSEKLDPEVEDILVDIAEDFVDSITTFGCSLAKHRKSDTLEAKDILLHLERNWNMTLPGFTGDEIKTYRKPVDYSFSSIGG